MLFEEDSLHIFLHIEAELGEEVRHFLNFLLQECEESVLDVPDERVLHPLSCQQLILLNN